MPPPRRRSRRRHQDSRAPRERAVCRYTGTPVQVHRGYRADAAAANELYRELQAVSDAHPPPEWQTIAKVRQGVHYHRLFSRLRKARPPELRLFTDEQVEVLSAAGQSGDASLREKAASARAPDGPDPREGNAVANHAAALQLPRESRMGP